MLCAPSKHLSNIVVMYISTNMCLDYIIIYQFSLYIISMQQVEFMQYTGTVTGPARPIALSNVQKGDVKLYL